MSLLTLHLSGTDVSTNRDISVADGYLYVDPVTGLSDYYTNTAYSTFETNPDGSYVLTATQELTGTTFFSDLSSPLVYKRETDIIFESNFMSVSSGTSGIFSQYSTFNFDLSGIEDSSNNIIRVDWTPISAGKVSSYVWEALPEYSADYVYKLATGLAFGYNPKNYSVYTHNYDLNSLPTLDDSLSTFSPSFSAFRQDGLVDVYNCSLVVSKDSIYNLANKLSLLDTQVLPFSSLDPLIKLELDGPDYVNNLVIRRHVTPTPTRTITSGDVTPTPTQTPTRTTTRSRTPTITRTKSQTCTPTQTSTQTQTVTPTQTQGVTVTPTPTYTATCTETRSFWNRVTPTPSKAPGVCISQEITVTYTGINDKVDPNDVVLSLVYNHDFISCKETN